MHSQGRFGVAVAAMLCAIVVSVSAQVATSSTQTKTFEVVAVQGNDVVLKLDDGTHEIKVSDDFRFLVDGQSMSVHQLKAGMIGTATIPAATRMTPVTVTEIKDGTVVEANASEIVVQTAAGRQSVRAGELDTKRGITVTRAGKPAQMSDLRKGDRLTATIISTVPTPAVAETAPARPSPPAFERAAAEPAPAAATEDNATPTAAGTSGTLPTPDTAAQELPRTGGSTPLIGAIGVSSLLLGVMLSARRRRRAR